MNIEFLYHWSPKVRRKSIQCEGLVIGKPCTTATVPQPFLCFSPNPWTAWELSGNTAGPGVFVAWDLWMATLSHTDEVRVSPQWGGVIREVHVCNDIPPNRITWIGERIF
jgi:hypothetical protein